MWKKSKLIDVCQVFADGDWIESKDQAPEGIRLLQTGNIKLGFFSERIHKARFINYETFTRLKCTEVFRGDLLVSRLPEPVGRACLIPELYGRAITAVDCTIIRPNDSLLPEFLNYYMQSEKYFLEVKEKITGATRQRISRKNLGQIVVPIPDLSEQQRIVAKLDSAFFEIDKCIELVKTQIDLQNSFYMNVLSREFIIGDSMVPLSELATDITDGDHMPPPKVDNGIPFITISNINKESNEIDFSKTFYVPKDYFSQLKEKRKPQKGDVLYSVTGSFGIPILVREEKEFCFQRHIAIIRPKVGVDSEWIYYLLKSPLVFDQASKGARGTAQKTVSLKVLRDIKVPQLDLHTQRSTTEKIRKVDLQRRRFKVLLEYKKRNLNYLKSAILSKEISSEFS